MKRILFTTAFLILLLAGVGAFWLYNQIAKDNVRDSQTGYHEVHVSKSSTYEDLRGELAGILIDSSFFDPLAHRMNLPKRVFPGKYRISNGMSNIAIVRKFRSGSYEQVKVLIRGSSNRQDILGSLGSVLEPDSTAFSAYVDTSTYLNSLGYSEENWPCLFMANTYYFNWSTSVDDAFKRFHTEKTKFWNPTRMSNLKRTGLSINEAIILASIVDAETMRNSELKRIAGLYLNRIQKGWPLQADPTVQYIAHSKGRQRVLNEDLKIEHPYNTYKNLGVPPGPILVPNVNAIDAVLQAENHDFMYMCANSDFTGYHLFTSSYAQHNINANRYRRALDARNIRR